MTDPKPVIIVTGPTASGKSTLSLALAEHYNGIIINADSMQIYDALATLTAQPDAAEQARAPHKLYSCLAPQDSIDAEKWRLMAIDEIRHAHQNGKIPIIVGGTGFYIRTLLQGLSPIPAVDPDIRQRGEAHLARVGLPAFYAELLENDPAIDGEIDAQNPRRVMRAWEVFEATGKSLIHWQSIPKSGPPDGMDFIVITVLPDRDWLYNRCNKRFETMLDGGAVDEVRNLQGRIENGTVPPDALITKAIGFPEISGWLAGDLPKDQAIKSAQKATRNYAKRQMTWGRNQTNADYTFDPSATSCDEFIARLKI